MSALMILSDSGAVNYILAEGTGDDARDRVGLAALLQAVLSCFAVAVGLLFLNSQYALAPESWLALLAVAVAQVCDGVAKIYRAVSLLGRDDVSYAAPELAASLIKLPIVATLWFTGSLWALIGVPCVSLAVLLAVRRASQKRLGRRVGARHSVRSRLSIIRMILTYGLGGSLSAVYSQAPVFVSASTLGAGSTAALTIVMRVTQPLELFPSVFATQALPRLRKRPASVPRIWGCFLLLGAVLACLPMLFTGPLQAIFALTTWDAVLLAVVAAALVPKSGNYILVSALLATGGVNWRLPITVVVGFAAVVASFALAASTSGVVGVASVLVCSEVLLACLLWLAILWRSK